MLLTKANLSFQQLIYWHLSIIDYGYIHRHKNLTVIKMSA